MKGINKKSISACMPFYGFPAGRCSYQQLHFSDEFSKAICLVFFCLSPDSFLPNALKSL